MRGEVAKDVILLECFGRDDLDHVRNWLGPLHLVPETAEAEARRAVGRAPETR